MKKQPRRKETLSAKERFANATRLSVTKLAPVGLVQGRKHFYVSGGKAPHTR